MADKLDYLAQEPRRTNARPYLREKVAPAEPQGFWGDFADAWMLDTSLGQLSVTIGSHLHGDEFDRQQRNRQDQLMADDDFNALENMRDDLYGLPLSLLEEVYNASSPAEVRRIMGIYEDNNERRSAVEDSFGARLLAGFLDPINLVPIPIAVGKGVWTGMKAAAPVTAGTMVSTEALRHGLDPTSTPEETAINIGTGFMMGEVIAGAAGAYQRGGMKRMGTRVRDSKTGKWVGNKIPRWMAEPAQAAGQKMENAFNRMEAVNKWINNPVGDLEPSAVRAAHMSEAEFASTIRKTLDREDIDYDLWLSGEAPDQFSAGAQRYAGPEGERIIIVERGTADHARLPIDERAMDSTASHAMYRQVDGDWLPVAVGARRDLVGQVDPFATRAVHSFNTPEAHILGQLKLRDLYPDAPDPRAEPEAYARWRDDHGSEVYRDSENVHQVEATQAETYSRIALDLDQEFRVRTKTLDDITAEIKANKREIQELKAKLKKTKDKGWQTRRKAVLKDKEASLNELQNAEFIAQGRLDQTRQHLIDAEKSGDPEDWDIKPTLTGIEQAFGATGQMPWYRLVKTKLRDDAPELAADWQRTAYELAGSPGLASYGHEAGKGAGASVESMARTWLGDYTRVKAEVDRIYFEEYAKIGTNPTPAAIWYLQKKQHAARTVADIKQKLRMGEVKDDSDLMSLDEFRSEVGKAMMRSDSHATEPLIAKGAREYRNFVRRVEQEGRKHGIFRTQQIMEHKIQKNEARIEHYEQMLDTIITRQATRDKYIGWIEDMEAENVELAAWIDASKNDLNKAWKGEQGEHAWFHRLWDLQAIDDNPDTLKGILREWFKENPSVVTNGTRKELPTTDVDIEARVEETFAQIRREAMLGDSLHVMSHGRASALEHNQDYLAKMNEHLAELQATAAEPRPRVDINEVTDYEGIKVVEPEVQRIHPEHGGKSPASMRRDADGNAIEIHINKAAVAETFRNKQWTKPRTKGIDPLPEDSFETVDDWLEFLLEHEFQHLNHPIIKARQKGYAANENAINRAAMKKLDTLKRQGKGFEIAVMQKRIKIIESRIERISKGGEGVPMTGMPTGLVGRKLDIPNELLIEIGKRVDDSGTVRDPGVDFIHTNVEHVLFHYTQRIAPIIEMAKRYGDFRMNRRIQELHQKIDEKIESAKPEEADRLAQERDELTQAIEDLRDKVLGTYGIPEDPSAISTRTIRLLMAWNTLTAMGRAFLTAINDIGMVVQVNGMNRMFGDLFNRFFHGGPESKWKLSAEEVEWAGQALEVQNAIRSRAIMDLPNESTGFNKLERWTYDQQGNFFFLNLLSGWTDFAKKFSGSMIQSKMIKNAIEWGEGTISKTDLEEMTKAGVTESMAKAWVREWKRAGSTRAKGDEGFFLANTGDWLDEDVVRGFRATLSQAIDNVIITPMAADKPNFMSKDFGRMVMQYHGFSMAATHRIFLSNMQKRDKRALNTVIMMVTLSMIIDQIKRPDYIQLDMDDQLYRAVELSGTLGMITDLNTMLEGATAGEYGFRSLAGLKNVERYSDWGSKIGAVAGAVPNQWLGTAAALTDSDASADKVARTLRYLVPYNNWWLWNDWVTRTQRTFADIAEE